jgi:signal transduction histidine kinase
MRFGKRLSTRVGLAVGALLVCLLVGQGVIIRGFVQGEIAAQRHAAGSACLELFTRSLNHGLPTAEELGDRPGGPHLAAYDTEGTALVRMPRAPERLTASQRSQTREDGQAVRISPHWLLAHHTGAEVRYVLLDDSFTMERLQRSRRRIVIVTTGVIALLGLSVTAFITSQLRRRLQHAKSVVGRMANGDLKVRLATTEDGGEVSALANDFNRMADRLSEHIAKLDEEGQRRRRIFADWTHEIATPLTSVLGYLESLCDGELPEERRQRYVRTAFDQARALEALTGDLSVLSQLESEGLPLDRVEGDVAALLRIEIDAAADLANATRIVLEPTRECVAQVDPHRVRQVFRNLLRNAVQHAQATVRCSCTMHATHWEVRIEDDGSGVRAGHLERLTESFYRADPSRARITGGRGLGLSIAQRVVDAHDGTLELSSEEGNGLRVRIRVPTAPS